MFKFWLLLRMGKCGFGEMVIMGNWVEVVVMVVKF